MVTGKDLIERGWPEGPTIGLAVAAARELSERGMDDDSIVRELEHMAGAMRLPVSVGGALMPDAHLGYGLPVGGVLATEGAVIPWAVGVDIACRMRISIFDVSPGVLDGRRDELA